MMKSKIFMCQNPGFCKIISTVFDGWIDCIHDCIHNVQCRWIQIWIWMDIDTDTNIDR